MTKHEAIEVLEEVKMLDDSMFAYSQAYNDALDMAIEALKAQEPRVMTLEEAKHLTYGSPYIIETNLPKEEPRLMYGLFSHLGIQGNFSFAFTDGRGYLFDVDYGKRWRCWTARPTEAQREAEAWE